MPARIEVYKAESDEATQYELNPLLHREPSFYAPGRAETVSAVVGKSI